MLITGVRYVTKITVAVEGQRLIIHNLDNHQNFPL